MFRTEPPLAHKQKQFAMLAVSLSDVMWILQLSFAFLVIVRTSGDDSGKQELFACYKIIIQMFLTK